LVLRKITGRKIMVEFIEHIKTEKVELEVVKCGCGFHEQ